MVTYSGVILGFVITAILYSRYLTTDENGLLKLLVSYSSIFAQFSSLGLNNIIVKFFPQFKNKENGHNGFLFYLVLISTAGFILFIATFLFIEPWLIQRNAAKSPIFVEYIFYLIPLTLFTLLYNTFDVYYRSLLKTVGGAFLKEVGQRLIIAIALLLYIFNIIDFHGFVFGYCFALSFSGIFLSIRLLIENEFSFPSTDNIMNRKLLRQIASVGLFGLITGSGNLAIANVDSIMINEIANTSLTGVYALTSYFGVLVSIPSRSFLRIGGPVISQAIKDRDHAVMKDIYYRSCLNQFTIGLLLVLGLAINLDSILLHILKEDYLEGRYVIVFIGLAHLMIMAGGANTVIIANSPYYKYMAYVTGFLFISAIATNWLLIPILGITGAALASFISITLFNLIKHLIIRQKFALQPYNFKYLLLIILTALIYLINTLLPTLDFFILDIAYRSTIVVILFVAPLYFFKIAPDINDLINNVLKRLGILN